ncbi:flagellin [Paenibacillus sp. FA6]|uniref:flagellin N-terminal helical domain-containing protein n=1 Tax=Paenibacillus sp. FA6 TaxID=3413029 RepID=UPI003F657E0C
MIIHHNIAAVNAQRPLGTSTEVAASNNVEKLSSELRINRADDDAARLEISQKARDRIRSVDRAEMSAQDRISLVQTAESALEEIYHNLQHMRELAIQASRATIENVDREKRQFEVNELAGKISRIATDTEFNNEKLLNGTFVDSLFRIGDMSGEALKVGRQVTTEDHELKDAAGSVVGTWRTAAATTKAEDEAPESASGAGDGTQGVPAKSAMAAGYFNSEGVRLVASAVALDASSVVTLGVVITTQSTANAAITTINNALNTVSEERSKLVVNQKHLEHRINNLSATSESLPAAESRIRDENTAEEMVDVTKNNIHTQAEQAMLAQANQRPQGIVQLLG